MGHDSQSYHQSSVAQQRQRNSSCCCSSTIMLFALYLHANHNKSTKLKTCRAVAGICPK